MSLDIEPPADKAPADEVVLRYVAGLSVKEDGSPIYSVFMLVETKTGERLATGSVIQDMDQEQLDHLRMQVGRVSTQDRVIREKAMAAKNALPADSHAAVLLDEIMAQL